MSKIAYLRADGVLCIVVPAPKESVEKLLGPMTDDDHKSHVWKKSVPDDAINPTYIEDLDIPADREFRNAWTLTNGKIGFDLVNAKKIASHFAGKKVGDLRAYLQNLLNQGYSEQDKVIITAQLNLKSAQDLASELQAMTPSSVNDIKSITAKLNNLTDS